MSVTPKEIRTIIEQYLKVLYPSSSDMEITFLTKDPLANIWKVNIRFKRNYYDSTGTIGNLSIDDKRGEITEFKEGWRWRS